MWRDGLSVGGNHLFVRILMIENFDSTILLPSYHHLGLIHGDLSCGTKNGDYISASTRDENRVAFKYGQSLHHTMGANVF